MRSPALTNGSLKFTQTLLPKSEHIHLFPLLNFKENDIGRDTEMKYDIRFYGYLMENAAPF